MRIEAKQNVKSLITLSEDTLASGCEARFLSLWNTTNGTLIKELQGHTSWVTSLEKISENLLASGSYNKEIFIWDITKGAIVKKLNGSTGEVKALVALSNDRLASISNVTIFIWDINSGNILKEFNQTKEQFFVKNITKYECLAKLNDSFLVSSSSSNGIITIWDIEASKIHKTKDSYSPGVYALAVISDELIAIGSNDKTIQIWNITSDAIIKIFKGHGGAPSSILALPDNKLATGSKKDFIIFDINTDQSFALLIAEDDVEVTSLALLTDKRFASVFNKYIMISL
jgi:WD40 repeat protein